MKDFSGKMAVLKLVFILICGVQIGTCIDWKITMFTGEGSGNVYLHVYHSGFYGYYIGMGNFSPYEVKEVDVNANFGKINSVRIHTNSNGRIHLVLLTLSDGTRSYTFPCNCRISSHASGYYWYRYIPATVCYWNDLTTNCADTMQGSCQLGECLACNVGYRFNGTTCNLSDPLAIDPCAISTPSHIPNIELYRPTNTHSISPDDYLREGWYTGGQYQLLTMSPELDLPRCGAESQIWMNGSLPAADGTIYDMQLCITNRTTGDMCAVDMMSIYVQNCTTHIMYYLTTPPEKSGYCFVSDPCSIPTPSLIPNIEMYRPTNTFAIDVSAYLREGWYSAGQYQLLTRSPELDLPRCGAESQIWMNGSFPAADGTDHVRQLCITNRTTGDTCMDEKMSTYIKNCETHIMYYLLTPPENIGYCFDIPSDSSDPPPSYLPTRAKVKFELKWISELISNRVSTPSLRFICDFERDETNAFYYVIYFQVDGSYLNFGYDLVVYDTAKAYVTEETLVSAFGFTAGITVSCSVGVRSSRNGRTGYLISSEGFNAGIKMLNHSVTVERGKSGSVYFEQTIPFGCMYYPSLVQSICTLNLHITRMSTENTCSSNTVHHRGQCALELPGLTKSTGVSSDTWTSQIHDFKMVSIESERSYYRLSNHQFLFNLETSSSHHQFWRNSKSDKLLEVLVSEGEETRNWQGRKCQVYCDPHMLSFDGMNYELQYKGQFMLFKSESPPMQVQVEITSCYNNGGKPYCACGLVAIAGRDLFRHYTCNGQRDINYKSCLDGVLRVVERSTKIYDIYLPTGAVVSVRHRSNGLLDIDITPTVHEFKRNISGLCGDFNGTVENDCVSKNGNMPCDEPFQGQRGYRYHPNHFTESYKLTDEENLLNARPDIESLTPYPGSYQTCACPKSNTNIGYDIETVLCSSRQYGKCNNNRKEVRCTAMQRRLIRKKRQVESTDDMQGHSITKRSTVIDETEAIRLCTEALKTVTNEACSDIGVNATGIEINNCAADLMLTGDGNWTKYAVDRSEAICLETIEKNTTLQEEYPEISNIIRNNTCPLNCSERGSCTNGKCECEEGFASEDCSFDLNTPLQIYGLDNDGLCDIDEGCGFVVVEGLEFPSDRNYTCQFSGRMTMVGEIYQTLEVFNVSADHQSIFEIICDIPDIDVPVNRLGIEYNVSAAMDGFEFGDAINFVVINTICQNYNNISGNISFYIQNGFCFINGTCYPEGAYKENALCLECKPNENVYTWSKSSSEDCVVSDKDTLDSNTNFMVVVVSAAGGFLFVCLLIFVMCCIYKKKKKSRQELSDITISESVHGKEELPSLAWLNEDMLISNILTKAKNKASLPKKNKRTKNPDIRNPKHDSHVTEDHSTSYISNASLKSTEGCDKERKKEISIQVKQASSNGVFTDTDERISSVATPNEEDSRDRILSRVEKETGRTNSNQRTQIKTDVGSTDLRSREREPALLESMLQSITSEGTGKRKKKKRKRDRRKVQPESMISEFAIVTEDENDRRAQKKSKKRKKERRKEISHPLRHADPLSDFCGDDEGVSSVAVQIDEVSRSRIEMKTEHGTARTNSVQNTKILEIDFNDGMTMVSDFCDEDEGVPSVAVPIDEVSRSRIEMKTEHGTARTYSVQNTKILELDFNDGMNIAKTLITDVNSNDLQRRGDTKEREPALSESMMQSNTSKATGKRKTKKRRDRKKKAPESPIGAADFVTEQHNDRRCKKKSKKIKKEQRKEQKRKSKHANSVGFCCNEDEGVPCEEAPEEEFSRNKIEMEAENEEARKRSNQKIQIIDSQSTDPDSKDDLYKAYLPMTNVATNNSLSREDTREREPTLLESILRLNPPKGTGKRKTKKRRKKRKNVHPIFL